MEINNEIAGLMARVLNDEASPEEKVRLADFLANNEDARQQFNHLRKVWSLKTETGFSAGWNAGWPEPEKLTNLRAKATMARALAEASEAAPTPVRRILPSFLKYAAAALILVTGAVFYFKADLNGSKKRPGTRKEIAAENGSRKRVMLPDGSTVLLNSGSKLEYNAPFDGKTRDVTLFGEAFFDVVKQPERPFIVHAGNIHIKVLGTAFNVKSYPDDDAVETTLIRGLVQINRTGKKESKPIYLHPNQKVTLPRCTDCDEAASTSNPKATVDQNKEAKVVTLGGAEGEKDWLETAWIHNRLEFKKSSFSEIAKKMERWYGVSIHINDASLAGEIFNGSFENETLEQALGALQKTTQFTFKINNNEVFIDVPK